MRVAFVISSFLVGSVLAASAFTIAVDSMWMRSGEGWMIRPIDTSLFAVDRETRSFVQEATISAPVEVVYAAWSDSSAFARSYAPDRPALRANIDLAIGGRHEWLWDGKTGGNGCQVLSFIPNRMISFTWNAPPDQPESRAKRTWVVVEFEPTSDGGTHLTLTHMGFGSAPHWDETMRYFDAAWPTVFFKFQEGPGIGDSPTPATNSLGSPQRRLDSIFP